MRRLVALIAVVIVIAGWAGTAELDVAAQDATPAADNPGTGVTVEEVAFAGIEEMPAAPALLRVVRYQFEPGASLVTDPAQQTIAVLYVEQGTLTIQLDDPVSVTGGENEGTPVAEIAAGTEIELGPGRAIALPPAVSGEIQNRGQEPAIVLASILEPLSAVATPTS